MKDQHREIDGWNITIFGFAHNVIIAERKFKWYDENRLTEIKEWLEDKKYRVFIRFSETRYKKVRKTFTIEIYKKIKEGTVSEHITEMMDDLATIFQ